MAVAFFAGAGWAGLALLDRLDGDHSSFLMPQFRIVNNIAGPLTWEVWFLFFGVAQIVGWARRLRWLRAVGATGMFTGQTTVFLAIVQSTPVSYGFATYLVCIFVEGCAIIYNVSCIVRFGEWPPWRHWTYRR